MPSEPFVTRVVYSSWLPHPQPLLLLNHGPISLWVPWFLFCKFQLLKSLIPLAKFSRLSHSPVSHLQPSPITQVSDRRFKRGPLRSDNCCQGNAGPWVYIPKYLPAFIPTSQVRELRSLWSHFLTDIFLEREYWSIVLWKGSRLESERLFESLLCHLPSVSWATYFYFIGLQLFFWKISVRILIS